MTRWLRLLPTAYCLLPISVLLAVGAARPSPAGTVEPQRASAASADPLAVEQALGTLKTGDWILKWEAMTQLARWKVKEAGPSLKAVLAGKDHPWVRGRALVALAELLGEEMLDPALAFAKDSSADLRAAAVDALGVIGSPRGEPAIVERLKDPDPTVRYPALVAYARLKHAAAWETLLPRLADENPAAVRHAIQALAYIATPESLTKLIELAAHKDKGVRLEAAVALSKTLAPEAIPVLLARMGKDDDTEVRAAAQRGLAGYDPKVLTPPLLAALRGEDPALYPPALKLLALQPSAEACDEVATLVREPNAKYAGYIEPFFGLLAAVNADRYQAIFARYLGHERADIRKRAIESLARCPKADLFALLHDSLADKEHAVRYAAFEAIRKVTTGAPPEGIVAYLADALASKDGWTYQTAIRLLGERLTAGEFDKGLAALDRFLAGSDTENRKLAAKALSQIGTDDAKRQIARAQGYLTDWKLIGPFPNESNRGYTTPYPPEQEIDFDKPCDSYAFGYGAAFSVAEGACGGVKKKALHVQPPWKDGVVGTTIASFLLDLPAAPELKLQMSLGLQDKSANSDGAQLAVYADKAKLFEQLLKDTWQPAEVNLTEFAGKKIVLELLLDPLKTSTDDSALIGEPLIVSGDKTVADLTQLAVSGKALVRVNIPEKTKPLTWQVLRVNRTDGVIPLHDILPPPTNAQLAYAVTDIESPDERKVRFWLETDDGFILWLNGIKVAERPNAGEHKLDVALRPGRNRLLIKVCNNREWWQFSIRATELDGRRLGSPAPPPPAKPETK